MSEQRWERGPLGLTLIGAIVATLSALAVHGQFALAIWGVYVGAFLALCGAIGFRRRVSGAEADLIRREALLLEQTNELEQQHLTFDQLREEVSEQLDQQATRIEHREHDLADRLLTFREWMEFPEPTDLVEAGEVPSQADYAEKDRQVVEILEEEAQTLYENIRSNKYVRNDKFELPLLRDDALALATRVAQVYQPTVENPLLETSIEQLVRASSRACLHLLVVLDRLPLNVQEYNVNSMYGYVRQAVKAYGVYQQARPFMPYLSGAYYAGRAAMGVNPISLGAWWTIGKLSQKGASALATHVMNRQALAFVSDLVRVVAYEMADVYGGDFRHRDPNWIFGVELTDLVSRFPVSREALSQALKEIGGTRIRNEYDRIFLYRCLAEHVSGKPEGYRAAEFLPVNERQAIARRLEYFFDRYIHGKDDRGVEKWRTGVEDRLDLKMTIDAQRTSHSSQEQIVSAIRSLASLIVGVKQHEPTELAGRLADTELWRQLDEEQRGNVLQEIEANPPFFFEQPDIDPQSENVSIYLADLARLVVRTPPHEIQGDEVVVDVAAYLRYDVKAARKTLDRTFIEFVADRMADDAPTKKVSADIARAILELLSPDEELRFVYSGVRLVDEVDNSGSLHLIGIEGRLHLLQIGEESELVWSGDHTTSCEKQEGLLRKGCRLKGGVWHQDSDGQGPVIWVPGAVMEGNDSYFKSLLSLCQVK